MTCVSPGNCRGDTDETTSENYGLSNVTWIEEFLHKAQSYWYSILDDSKGSDVATSHIYFQLANVFFLLAFLSPNGCILCLGLFGLIGSVFYALWGYDVLCSLDTLAWSIAFILVNMFYIFILLYQLRPRRFSMELEQLYAKMFKPLKVTRSQFKTLLKCMKEIKSLKYQEMYAREKVTKVENLCVVLSGKFVISQDSRPLHIVFSHQFLDSPEWFGVSTDDFFQVTITAIEESRILLWHRDKLRLSIMEDDFLQTVLEHIISRDVVKKLVQVNETIASTINGYVPFGGDIENHCDKSLIIVKKNGEGPGFGAFYNHRLQERDAYNELQPLLHSRGMHFQHTDLFYRFSQHNNN